LAQTGKIVGVSNARDMSREAPSVFDQLPQQNKLARGKIAGLNHATFSLPGIVAEIR